MPKVSVRLETRLRSVHRGPERAGRRTWAPVLDCDDLGQFQRLAARSGTWQSEPDVWRCGLHRLPGACPLNALPRCARPGLGRSTNSHEDNRDCVRGPLGSAEATARVMWDGEEYHRPQTTFCELGRRESCFRRSAHRPCWCEFS